MWHFVVQAQGLFEVVVGQHVQDRGEGFVAHHVALRRHFGDGRRYVVGVRVLIGQLTLATKYLATFVAGLGQRALHGVERLLVDQRAHQVVLAWVADAHLAVGSFDAGNHFVLDRTVHDQAAQGGATLAGGADCGEQDATHGQVEVGARGQDHGVVATQLEDAAAEAGSHTWADFAPHAGAAGGADQRYARVVDHGFAGFTAADHQLCQASRGITKGFQGFFEQRLAGQGGQRGLLGRFPYHRVTGDQGQGSVPGPDCDREVEGADHADHAQRVPGFTHVVARALGSDGQAVQLARQANGEVADVDHFLHFAQAFLGDLAGFDRNQLAEVGLVLTQHLAEQAHQLATARGRHAAPGFEGALGLIDAGDGLGLAEQFHRGDLAAVDRRVNRVVALGVSLGSNAKALEQSSNHLCISYIG